jgi:hypothetical protein
MADVMPMLVRVIRMLQIPRMQGITLSLITQMSDCGVVLDPRKNFPQQRVFVVASLTIPITQSDSHKPLTLKFC